MKLYVGLRTVQKPRICHFDVSVDIFDSHHSSQGIIDQFIQRHFSGVRHDGFNGRFATLRLTDEQIHHKEQDQFALCTDYREKTTSLLVELIESSEKALNGIGGIGNTGTSH